jgi:hypothetical protein
MIQYTNSRISGMCTNRSNSGPVTQNFWLTQIHGFQIFWNLHKLVVILKAPVSEYQECPQNIYMIQNTDSRISGMCTKCLFFDSKQLVQIFWTSHTEFLADTKARIPDFLEFAETGCNSQSTSFRISGMSTEYLHDPKHRFQNIWNVHEMFVF